MHMRSVLVLVAVCIISASVADKKPADKKSADKKPADKKPPEKLKVKIVEIPHHNRHFPSYTTDAPKPLIPRAPPAILSGPPHFHVLNGLCFQTKQKSYTYNVCPFQNITQLEERSLWSRYQGILGMWRQWIVEGDRFVGLHFAMGDRCQNTDRKVNLMFKCSTITQLVNVTEPKTCYYHMWLHTPLACFKGALQVYRVLNQTEVKQWDTLTREYLSGEWTLLGLKKQQDRILLQAGLLYNFSKDSIYKENPPEKEKDRHVYPVRVPQNDCKERVAKLNSLVEDLREELNITKQILSKSPQLVLELQQRMSNRLRTNTTSSPNKSEVAATVGNTTISKDSTARVILTDDGVTTQPLPAEPNFKPTTTQPQADVVSRPLATESRLQIDENRPLTTDNRPLADDNRPLASESRPLADDNRPLASESRPLADDNRPLVDDKRPLTTDNRPLAAESRPLGNDRRDKGARKHRPQLKVDDITDSYQASDVVEKHRTTNKL